MATVRKKYKNGGRVPIEDIQSSEVQLEEPSIAELLEPEPTPEPEPDDAILRAAKATFRAEELAQKPHIEQTIDAIPGLSEHKRAFLKANPQFVTDSALGAAASKAYFKALAAGIKDDSPEINNAILEGVARELNGHREADHVAELLKAAPPPTRSEPAQRKVDDINTTLSRSDLAPEPPAPSPQIKRSMPVTAPVSRADVTYSGGPRSTTARSITLTAEERLIARNSFGSIKGPNGRDIDLTNEQKEALYARNKQRMLQMKANGTLNE